jgi:hypothetical protein
MVIINIKQHDATYDCVLLSLILFTAWGNRSVEHATWVEINELQALKAGTLPYRTNYRQTSCRKCNSLLTAP